MKRRLPFLFLMFAPLSIALPATAQSAPAASGKQDAPDAAASLGRESTDRFDTACDRVCTLEQKNAALEKYIASLKKSLAARDTYIAALKKEVARLSAPPQ